MIRVVGLFIPDPDPGFLPIPDPDPDPQHWYLRYRFVWVAKIRGFSGLKCGNVIERAFFRMSGTVFGLFKVIILIFGVNIQHVNRYRTRVPIYRDQYQLVPLILFQFIANVKLQYSTRTDIVRNSIDWLLNLESETVSALVRLCWIRIQIDNKDLDPESV